MDEPSEIARAERDFDAYRRGELKPARKWEVIADDKGGFLRRSLPVNPENAAVLARLALQLSQDRFAKVLGVSTGTLQAWEQGRRRPSAAATVLLKVASLHPEVVLEAVHHTAPGKLL